MLGPKDLGFLNPVLIFVFAFCPIVGFVIRWKWRAAVARKQEIMRLVVLASEEAARAELEATVEYGTTSVASQFQCAVCYCPTTTRCSRCKAVRYCSGKCQIIHWRQGHKEECRPASTSILVNDEESERARMVLVQEQPEIQGNSSETHEKWNIKLVESEESAPSKFSCSPESPHGKGDDNTVEHLLDIKRTKNISGSSISPELATCSKPSILNVSLVDSSVSMFSAPIKEPLADACISELPSSTTADRSEASLCNEIADDTHDSTNVKSTETFKGSLSDFSSLSASVNGSCSSKLKIMENSCNDGETNCKSVCFSSSSINSSDESSTTETSGTPSDLCKGSVDSNESRTDVHVDHACSSLNEAGNGSFCDPGSILKFSFNLSVHTIPTLNSQLSEPKNVVSDDSQEAIVESKKPAVGAARFGDAVPEASKVKSSPLGSERKDSVAECVTSGLPVLMSTGIRSVSSSVCDDSSYSKARVHLVPSIKPGQSEVTGAMQHASNGLKTSMRKVVHQFRASKLSKHYPFGSGDISRRYDYKMLFPYDLFVKLYNWNKSELRPCGLTNCGNSCYANAVLQCLAFTRPLAAYLLQGLHSKSCSKKEWCFLCEFESLIMKAMEGKSPLSPIGILSQIQNIGSNLGHGKEEDAHEFLRYAVDTMQSVFLKETGISEVDPLADQTTLIGMIFGGYLRSKIKCMKCHGKSERHERMMDLTVEIHGDIGTLEEALAQFTATEILDGENKYQCSRCKSYEKAKKKLTILEAPNVLTIALKRFQSGKFGKINKSVRFPETLDLAPYMSGTRDKSPVYRLYAVVVHLDVMNAAFSGHYVCYVKNNRDRWFKIDDSTVKPVDLDRVLSKGAYMLLYARCSPRAPSLVRDMLMSYGGKISRRYLESVCSSPVGKGSMPKERFNPAMPTDPSMARQRPEDYPRWLNLGGLAGSGSFDSDDGRFHAIHRLHMDSSSDNSSLFSFSDEGSCSTESTRDSTSTEDLSDYIFGEVGRSWNSPWRNLSDSDTSSSPMFSRHSPNAAFDGHASGSPQTSGHQGTCTIDATTEAYELQSRQFQGSICKEDMEGAPFLYPDTSKQCRKLTNCCHGSSSSSSSSSCSSCRRSSSSREADSEWQGWVNPFNMKSVVSFRKSSREKTAQTFY